MDSVFLLVIKVMQVKREAGRRKEKSAKREGRERAEFNQSRKIVGPL